MCEECIEKYKNLPEGLVDALDVAYSEILPVIERLSHAMPNRDVGSSVVGPDGKPIDMATLPEEEQREIHRTQDRFMRSMALGFLAGYGALRYVDDIEESVVVQITLPSSMQSGAQTGHVTRVFSRGGAH